MKNFVEIDRVDKNVSGVVNKSVLAGLIQRGGFYAKRLGDKVGLESEVRKALHWKIFIFPWMARKVDVAISRVFFPTRVFNNLPLVYHSGFPPNRYVGASSLEDRREGAREAAQFYQKNTEATIFSTRGAISRFRRLVPEDLCDKIVYLPYFLPDVEPVESDQIDRTFSDSDSVRILIVAEDGKKKGVHNFLEAVEIVVGRYPDLRRRVEVTVVSRSDIGRHDFAVEHHRYLPHPQVLEKFRDARIFCLPTQKDSYGLVFIEAMASGCAIIADDSPVRKEILGDGDAGLLSDPHDPEDIADKLESVIHSPEYAEGLAKQARERFLRHYHWRPVGERYVDLFRVAASGQ
ncbi:glycosyltransferase family 4 protein [Salinibacter ruber]|uniref:glycosyltransferase family 4 protein n=1 Tax=Salinibacter ruber TaxID=146919 RepID=UPI0013C2C8BC|nr:glycosyltransferase family 4 protein [Salinibacter ruber]